MRKHLLRKTIHIILLAIALLVFTGTVREFYAQNFLKKSENNIIFPKNLNKPDVDFNLKSTGSKKFKIILEDDVQQNTAVKIFDIIGNLIMEDTIKPKDGKQKTYDFSHITSELFVVEVGNSKYNKTKSIYANPQGVKKHDVARSKTTSDHKRDSTLEK
ncbi:hypothetical protein [Echinicola vietnamensis]|uniref:Uncharacterized protein n=1 Tax=Echinicola vietnamensis (strain DSM 17526 / LMG 23754 / KMM 6221) TaxID=926556 RepID=L0G0Y9_ECHVK|nr:hypothetical protein [Echinicola vietnamensis]AGA78671.1 hypothetical protein Echvi_2424 [Echinicola vietnamensis DSM 17526]